MDFSPGRRFTIALAVVMALLVAGAMPAQAATSVEIVSEHDTAADFNAGTLSGGMEVNGTGEDAVVEVDGGNFTETFTFTGAEQTWEVPAGVNEVDVELDGAGGGRSNGDPGGRVVGTLAVTPGEILRIYVGGAGSTGANSGGFNGGGDGQHTDSNGATSNTDSGGGGGASDIRQNGSTLSDRVAVAGGGGGGGDASGQSGQSRGAGGAGGADTGEDGGDASSLSASGNGGSGGTQASGGSGGSGSTSNGDAGTLGSGGNGASASVFDAQATGGGGGGGYYGGGGGGAGASTGDDTAAGGGGGGGSNYDDDLATVDENSRGNGSAAQTNGQVNISYTVAEPSATYISQNHTVEGSVGGEVNITKIDNGSVTVTFEGWNGSAWTQLNQTTGITTTGVKDFTWSEFTDTNTVRVNVTVFNDTGTGGVQFTMASEGVKATAHNPELNNLTASPTGEIQDSNPTLSIDVNDTDFSKAHGDNVTGTFQVKEPGETSFDDEGTDSRTSNGTLSLSFDAIDGGTYEWKVNATDSPAGLSNESDTFTFEVPSNVTFRNESNGTEIITGVTITATFFSADGTTVIQKTDTNEDGNISLSGLPTTQEFVMSVEADGWHTRRVYIEDIFQQSDIYLLNSTVFPGIDTTFTYEDRTGEFPRNSTTLRIQRAIDKNGDDNFNWTTVAGDFWGAAGEFPFTGEAQARYRLVIENEEGTQRVLGTHIPEADGTKNVIVGQLEWPAIDATGRTIEAEMQGSDNQIAVTYVDPSNETTSVRIAVWELGNTSNEIYNQSHSSGPYGTLNVNVDGLTDDQTEMSWVVNFTAQTNDDGEITGQTTVGASPFDLPIDPWLLGTFVFVGLTFITTLYGPRTATLGAWVLVASVGIVMIFQWADIPTASLIAAAGVAAGGTLYREAVPG